ncbi:hypothetical protein CHS0354_009635 [Potamilus streckersoni]|uniref:DNA-directed RNA polymerase III subunit RPC9 n=1 Tax=Potamilus streckersoni TaxID=2493646 RepID=A0AAE0S444_9BIVA|nr:hypothetical protein CHS0354_009635 [Potamilus streckersoni]
MEVVNKSVAMLSNYEVYSLLTDIQAGRGQKKPQKSQQNLATITYEVVQYLENTYCKNLSPEIITAFMKALEPFKLTKAEKLQLLNNRPTAAVEIQLIVEESEERLTEDQIYLLLDIIQKHLPGETRGRME